jgi:hypothetical protein
MYYNVTFRHVCAAIVVVVVVVVVVEKQWVLHNLSVCTLALGIQHAMHMRHIVICGLPCSAILFHFSHKGHDFRKKKLLNTKCVLISFTTYVLNISHSEKNWARYDKLYWSSYKVPFILVIF